MSDLNGVDQAAAEQQRVESDLLPMVIKTVGGISAAAGVAAVALSLTDVAPWLFGAGVTCIVAAPFLYGFADIVTSLRRLCAKQ